MFQILSGVRRAKIRELAGEATILADILDGDGRKIARREIELVELYSPKHEIDLRSDSIAFIRFKRLQSLFLAGVVFDAIEVMPGSNGTRLSDVEVLE